IVPKRLFPWRGEELPHARSDPVVQGAPASTCAMLHRNRAARRLPEARFRRSTTAVAVMTSLAVHAALGAAMAWRAASADGEEAEELDPLAAIEVDLAPPALEGFDPLDPAPLPAPEVEVTREGEVAAEGEVAPE